MECHETTMAMGSHTMSGLPGWVLAGALVAAGLVTLWALMRGHRWLLGAESRLGGWRLDLTSLAAVRSLLGRRPFQFMLQLPLVAALGLIIVAGFRGTPVADRNAATVLTWTLWWTLLIVDIVLLGRMWCLVCPWDAVASWIRRLAFWRRTDEPLALNLPWPKALKNVYPATFLFVVLVWLELGYGVTMSPRATAVLGLLMVLLAVIPALFFEKRSFCKYGCLIGRICGLYSLVAPVEVRARDAEVCRSCRSKDCLVGNEHGYPCPTGLCLGTLSANTYCTVCTECVKTCRKDNVAVNLRPWCSDLHGPSRGRRDEAILALVMLSLTSFHGLTMTPAWPQVSDWLQDRLGVGYLTGFTLGMSAIILLPAAVYLLFSYLAAWLLVGRQGPVNGTFWRVASGYAYPLIAVALMYHLAHNAGHLLMEGAVVIPVLSDPLGWGMDLFGTAGMSPGPLASQAVIWTLAVALVLLGHWWAMRAMESAHRAVGTEAVVPMRARIVMASFFMLATAANLWLLAQPMEMRTGM